MTQVLVLTSPASPMAMALAARALPDFEPMFHEPGAVPAAALAQAEVVLGAPCAIASLLEDLARVRWAQSTWAGVAPLIGASRRDYQLTGVKDIFGPLMSEYVLGWLLAIERRIIERAALSHWHGAPDRSLAGRSIGIMGTGSIGSHVAQTCAGFGLSVRGLNSDGRTVPGFDRCFAAADRLAFAEGLDYLVAVLPDTTATTGLVDSRLLALLGEQAIFINAGRANCVREPDLLRALEHGPLAAAVLDVLPQEPLADDDPLWQVERLYITSHSAAPTAVDAAVDVFCDNYRRYQSGQELRYVVDFERGY